MVKGEVEGGNEDESGREANLRKSPEAGGWAVLQFGFHGVVVKGCNGSTSLERKTE